MALNFLVWIILHCGWLSCNCRMFRLILGLYAVDASSMILSSSSLPPTHNNWNISAAAAAKSLQSCLTLCDPIDGSPPGSAVPGILQARTLEWVAISFSNAWKWKVKVKLLSRVQLSDPMDCSLPDSSVHGIFQARVLEWGAIAFSNISGRWLRKGLGREGPLVWPTIQGLLEVWMA